MKTTKLLKLLGLSLLAALAAAAVCGLAVRVFGPAFADWAASAFYETSERFTGPDGRVFAVTTFRWELVYGGFCAAAAILAFLWVLSLLISRHRAAQKASRDTEKAITALFTAADPGEGQDYPDIRLRLRQLREAYDHGQALIRAESARKDDLIAYLAHDLKTPLTSVIGYLELLTEAPDMPQDQRARYTGIALQKADRLESLISDFFEITRYNIHDILLEREDIDLSYMLVQLKEEFWPILREKGSTLDLELGEDLTVNADREKLGRVLGNVLKNACAYASPNTPITLRAEQTEQETVISVSNLGRTIPAQKLQHIFEKFYRLDQARSTSSGGAGLGLAIAREIMLAHGGSIRADSRDGVTTFTVTLPKLRNSLGDS